MHAQDTASILASGAFGGTSTFDAANLLHATGTDGNLISFDPQLSDLIEAAGPVADSGATYTAVILQNLPATADLTMIKDFGLHVPAGGDDTVYKQIDTTIQPGAATGRLLNVRRLNRLGVWDGSSWTDQPLNPSHLTGGS